MSFPFRQLLFCFLRLIIFFFMFLLEFFVHSETKKIIVFAYRVSYMRKPYFTLLFFSCREDGENKRRERRNTKKKTVKNTRAKERPSMTTGPSSSHAGTAKDVAPRRHQRSRAFCSKRHATKTFFRLFVDSLFFATHKSANPKQHVRINPNPEAMNK